MDGLTGESVPTRRRFLALSGLAIGGLSGCLGRRPPTERPSREATLTVRLTNRDDVARSFEVIARQGDSVTDSFSGTLPPSTDQPVVMVATFRITDDQYQFSIATDDGQRGRTWDPSECADFLVEAAIENTEPTFEAHCRTDADA